ncbi:hypothetical protein F5Y03DRAFT_375628 [Xylaria venustula]|nr:hypothetical protein F5Y03DRAFT_375628 [Xylaria venustula]
MTVEFAPPSVKQQLGFSLLSLSLASLPFSTCLYHFPLLPLSPTSIPTIHPLFEISMKSPHLPSPPIPCRSPLLTF